MDVDEEEERMEAPALLPRSLRRPLLLLPPRASLFLEPLSWPPSLPPPPPVLPSRILEPPLRAMRLLSMSSLLRRRMVPRYWMSSMFSSLSCRGRLGIRSPADCRIINSVCQPGVDCSWNVSARSCCVATRQSKASSSYHRV